MEISFGMGQDSVWYGQYVVGPVFLTWAFFARAANSAMNPRAEGAGAFLMVVVGP